MKPPPASSSRPAIWPVSIWTLPVVTLLALGGSFSWFTYAEYRQAVEREFRELESGDHIAVAEVTGLLRGIELLLNEIAREQAVLTAQQRAVYDQSLASRQRPFPEVRALAVLDLVRPTGQGTTATLFNRESDVIYRVPNPERFKDVSIAGAVMFKEHVQASDGTTRHIGVSAADGKRIYATSRLGQTGLSVSVSRRFDDVLVVWHQNILIRLMIFALTAAVTIALARIARRRERERDLLVNTLNESNQFRNQVIVDAQEGIVVYGPDLRYQVWNPHMEQISGYRATEVIGRHPLDRFPELKDNGVFARLQAAEAGVDRPAGGRGRT